MNFGEDNMNYMPEDSYGGSGGRGQYNSDYNMYNGGPHHDASVHSSHVSLHSNGSNRNNPLQMKLSHSNLGSRTSLPHDQPPQNSDNYAPYSSFQRPHDDYEYRGSPMPSNGSPRGPETPTRSNNYDDYDDSYRNPTSAPHAYESNSNLRYGDQESFEKPMQNQLRPDSPNYIDPYRGQPGDDRYAPQPEDSFYRQSPMLDRYQGEPGNRYDGGGGQDPRDNYMDQPGEGYRGDNRYMEDSFQDQRDNSFQGQPEYNGQPYGDRYGQPLNDSYQDGPPSLQQPGQMDGRYGEPLDDSYRGPQDDSFRGPPQDDSFRGHPQQDGRFDDDGYRDYGPDRYDDQPTNQSFQDPSYPDGGDPYSRRHEGLPQVQDDPFADDPFRQKQRSLQHLHEGDMYQGRRSPDRVSDRQGPTGYPERPPQYDHMDGQPSYDQDSEQEVPRPYYGDEVAPAEAQMVRGVPDDYLDDGRRTPSTQGGSMRWRAPDLPEIIDYLSHPSDAIKANAAAYLTHLSFMDDGIKGKIKGLDGIPLLVDLLNSDFPEVHKNACCALKNLSYGRTNDENKKAVKNAGGIPALVRLLRKTQDEDVKDAVTGVLWNLSSSDDLKKPIIDDGLAILVNVVIIPHSGWERRGLSPYQAQEPWTTIFRNATGVLRNVSSAGPEARKKLRECHGLVESLIHTLRTAIDQNNVDNKPVENCVCTLRNLAFRIQEVSDPEFFRKRNATLQRQKQQEKGEKVGCFGGGGKKKSTQKGKNTQSLEQMPNPQLPPTANEYKGLWGVDAVRYFLQLLQGANPVTLEGACGAIQNLAACDWKPAVEIRALVRKEKGLPNLVDLLTYEQERVVGASATALRNLSVDERNKELVGKYAMKQLVSNLPQDSRPKEITDDTVCAVLACLNEVIQHNQDFSRSFLTERGLPRLIYISRNQPRYSPRTVKFTASVLKSLWKVKVLHSEYQTQGYSEKDFNPTIITSNASTPYSTINRPIHNQGYDDTTLSSRRANPFPNGHNTGSPHMVQGHSNPAVSQPDRYGSRQERIDEVPMTDIAPGYAPIDDPHHAKNRPPVGGVALFPNLPPGQQPAQQEPLYAIVNKRRREEMGGPPSPGHAILGDQGQEGADSWV